MDKKFVKQVLLYLSIPSTCGKYNSQLVDVKFSEQQELITLLLEKYKNLLLSMNSRLDESEITSAMIFSYFFSYHELSTLDNNKIISISSEINTKVKNTYSMKLDDNPSSFEKDVIKYIRQIYNGPIDLNGSFNAYSFDCLCTVKDKKSSKKINIEIDGPHHYINFGSSKSPRYKSRPQDILRDKILHHAGYDIVRIPLYEWSTLSTDNQRCNYLKNKLSGMGLAFSQETTSPSGFGDFFLVKRVERKSNGGEPSAKLQKVDHITSP